MTTFYRRRTLCTQLTLTIISFRLSCLAGPAVRYSQFEAVIPKPPPLLGQHTVDVLKTTLGYEDDTIQELLCSKVITQHEFT